ncbi:hypothetical protein GMLC_08730 [Geomonas limicola]|uniref:Uncharacterized protein n=1 Tax=Geomonas limicola TaxID=2740186 RepID=A0A6V8N5U3_9BACT|nr:hypothetical protein GMLC_08730 [Geomonas limicola]
MRVKEVVIINRLGASEMTVIMKKICSTTATSPGLETFPIPTLTVGIDSGSAPAVAARVREARITSSAPRKALVLTRNRHSFFAG